MRAARFTLLVSALTVACGGPELGDLATSTVELSASGVALAPEQASLGEPQGRLGVTRLFLSTSSLTLVPCAAEAREIVLGPRGYDLLAEPRPREIVSTSVTQLCALRFDIDPLSRNAAEGVPEGAALYVEGTDAEGAEFSLATETSSSITLAGSAFGSTPLLLTFDVSSWLAGVTVTNIEEMPDPVRELVDSRTEAAFSLFADLNGDQALQDEEQPPIASAAAP